MVYMTETVREHTSARMSWNLSSWPASDLHGQLAAGTQDQGSNLLRLPLAALSSSGRGCK